MNLEGLVEFMDDSALFNTHVPHDEFDAPLKVQAAGYPRPFSSTASPSIAVGVCPFCSLLSFLSR
jgi:hypothetical protein